MAVETSRNRCPSTRPESRNVLRRTAIRTAVPFLGQRSCLVRASFVAFSQNGTLLLPLLPRVVIPTGVNRSGGICFPRSLLRGQLHPLAFQLVSELDKRARSRAY